MKTDLKRLKDYVRFNDPKLEARYADDKIPMSELIESYFAGEVDITGDLEELLRNKDLFVKYSLVTKKHMEFLLTRFIPEVAIHSKKQDERIVRAHYDRGNDFFAAFLGPRMVYTSGFFKTGKESLEQAQDQKMDLVCQKMQLKKGETHLDIGCGWGTLAMHAAKKYGTDSTGVTIAQHQTSYGNEQIANNGVKDRARILCLDYRDIPNRTWDKISCLEMAEHVGVKNFQKFMNQIFGLLADDGIFYLQIAGLRRGFHFEDLVWGLFMNKYIFSGADASMPLSFVVDKLEKAGFEIHSVENVGIHYSLTIKRWYDNWLQHRDEIVAKYGEQWFRIWHVFLGWSVQIAAQGSSTCFQIVCNKNTNQFDRMRWIGQPQLGEQGYFFTQ
jgi:cyclopropane fatty-acyl-phospholipid synthase-like methyltransferase